MIRLAVEHLPHGVLIVGETGRVLAANRMAETVFGYATGRLVGQSIARLLPETPQDAVGNPWKSVRTNQQNRTVAPARRVAGIRADGSVLQLDIGFEVVGDGANHHVVVTFTDVTERPSVEVDPWTRATAQSGIQPLIADLAMQFVSIEPDAIDNAVTDSLRLIAEALRLDRAIVWRERAGDAGAVASHYWLRPSQPSPPEPLPLASIRFLASKLEAREAVWFTHVATVPDPADREVLVRHGLTSAAFVPLAGTVGEPAVRDFLAVSSTTEQDWAPAQIEQLSLVAALFGEVLARKAGARALQIARDELHQLRVGGENASSRTDVREFPSPVAVGPKRDRLCLRPEVEEQAGTAIVGRSAAITSVLHQARQVAATDSTVLLLGETGTGKELLALHIHELSSRRGHEMVCVNCSAIPSTLIESELFGRERGAFTGAVTRQAGRFELADRSTIFLDEIGELPSDIQVKLLRVLESREVERLGCPKAIRVNVRVIAATNRNLEQRIAQEKFREDLFYRLNVFPIHVPLLRERIEDIPMLVWRFVDEFAKSFGKRIDGIPKANMAALEQYPWPGNIRELRNVVERAMIVARSTILTIDVPSSSPAPQARSIRMADVEREHIRNVLESTGWRIRGARGAADRLGLRPTTLETRMIKLGLRRPQLSS
jgi:formate hydrogenlyase transcriptional activator